MARKVFAWASTYFTGQRGPPLRIIYDIISLPRLGCPPHPERGIFLLDNIDPGFLQYNSQYTFDFVHYFPIRET